MLQNDRGVITRRFRNPLRIVAIAAIVMAALFVPLPSASAHEVPHVFVYSGTSGFRHLSIPHAQDALARAAGVTGAFTVEFSDDPASFTADALASADAVVWLSTTGSTSPLTDAQEQLYEEWVRCGGGHVGIHASTDSWDDGSWPAWEELTGAFFAGHPVTPTSAADDSFTNPRGTYPVAHAPQAGVDYVEGDGEPEASIVVADDEHRATAPWRGEDGFQLRDEYYAFDRDPAEVTVDFRPLLTFGGFTDPAVDAVWGGDYPEAMPVSWTGSFRGQGRIFYSNLGHSIRSWYVDAVVDHMVAGILWAADAPRRSGCRGASPAGKAAS